MKEGEYKQKCYSFFCGYQYYIKYFKDSGKEYFLKKYIIYTYLINIAGIGGGKEKSDTLKGFQIIGRAEGMVGVGKEKVKKMRKISFYSFITE